MHNAVVLEECANMAYFSNQLTGNKLEHMDPVLLNKHFKRKHGPNSYYGQG